MKAELNGVMEVFNKPFAAKAMLFNYNIPFLNSIINNSIFIQLKRDPVTNIASVLDARKRQMGNIKEWYSFEIPEYTFLKELDPISQCAGQVYSINKAIDDGMEKVDEARKLVVQYEDFCSNPSKVFEKLKTKLGLDSSLKYKGPTSFDIPRNHVAYRNEIEEALARFSSQ